MGRRIDVELTSRREDGRWTWRAAGARQPKGDLDQILLYEGARVGDVVRAEADFEIDGIVITSVLPPAEKKRPEPQRVEITGPPRDERGVISTVVSRADRPRGDDQRRGEGRPRHGDEGARPRPRGEPARGPEGGRRREPGPGGGRAASPSGARRPRAAPSSPDGRARPERRPKPEPAAPAPRPKRLNPGSAHRDAVLADLPPEHRPIAEQALRGGLPGVRQAVEAQNAALREQGEPEVKAEPLLAIAEQLLPRLKEADWRDRAEAAVTMMDDLSLRDLRSVVTGADKARHEEGRLLAGTLREALERRLSEQREAWLTEITAALEDGRLVRALRLSARPPDPGIRFPAQLALRLSEAAGAAMTADAPADRWQALLEAVVDSPVRRSVKPAAIPSPAPEALLHTARQAAGKVPALAPLLGIAMPPPPGPPRPVRPGAGAARGRP